MKPEAWYLDNLVCPRHQQVLRWDTPWLVCPAGDAYAVIEGIPVLLVDDVKQTHESATSSLERGNVENGAASPSPKLFEGVHPFVQRNLTATNGIMYRSVRLSEYPIPEIRLPVAQRGELMLDIGCNWGRWCVAAARKNYQVVGIDPSLEAVLAARAVTKQLGVEARFVVGDARFLPFRTKLFDVIFSYSVLQHFSKENAKEALRSIQRVLKDDGFSEIQMLSSFGARSIYNRAKYNLSKPHEFDVRYWSPRELRDSFSEAIGPTRLFVDGFFSANAQRAEAHVLPARYRMVVQLSEFLRGMTRRFPILANVADSLYVVSSGSGSRLDEIARPLRDG